MQESHGLTLPVDRAQYIAEQQCDVTLGKCLAAVLGKEEAKVKKAAYYLEDGMLMRTWSNPAADGVDWGTCHQVVVLQPHRQQVLSLAHDHPWSGHLGVTKTHDRVLKNFFWPKVKRDVAQYCRACHVCQLVGKPNQVIPPAPLQTASAQEAVPQ